MKLLRQDKGYEYIGKSLDGLFMFKTPYGDIVAYSNVKFLLKEGRVLFGDVGDLCLHCSNNLRVGNN